MPEVIAFITMFVATFIQGAIGFGSALIAMPILIQLLGIPVAAPLFAIVAQTGGLMTILHYRQSLRLRSIWRLILSAFIGIVPGITLARLVDEHFAMWVLGIIIILYSLYALLSPRLPEIKDKRWAYAFGFLYGLLHGAYNTGGPPIVIYGNTQRWNTAEFKSNLQAMFFTSGLFVVAMHAFVKQSLTPQVLHYYVILVPATLGGLLLGYQLDRVLKPETFRKLVLIMLIVLGVTLIV
jgi:uncharacterized membrane protein YfcA